MRVTFRRNRSALRRTPVIGTAALAALALALAGCSMPGSSKDASALEKTSLTVGMLPIVDNVQLKVAIDQGLFKAEGLSVKTQMLAGGAEAVPKIKSGQLDVSFGSYVPFFAAQTAGEVDLRIVADGAQSGNGTNVLLVARDSPIHSVRDLVGKKIAVNVTGSLTQLLVEASLKPGGVEIADKNFVAVPFPEMEQALNSKRVDAVQVSEPFNTQLQKSIGARVLVDVCQGATADFPLAGYAATAQFAKKNPNTIAAFRRAIVKAQGLLQDRAIAEQTLTTYTKIDAKTAATLNWTAFPTSLSTVRLQRVIDFMKEYDYIRKDIDVKSLVVTG